MSAITSVFTGVGNGAALRFESGEVFDYAVGGTFVADMELVRFSDRKATSVQEVIASVSDAALSGSHQVDEPGFYGWRCATYTSGTVSSSLTVELDNQEQELVSDTGWADFADTEYTEGSPLAIAADTVTEFPINNGFVRDSQTPADVADAGGFFVQSFIAYDNLSGAFQVGETITGGTSGDTAVISSIDAAAQRLYLQSLNGDFQDNEVLTGGTSGATANANGARVPSKITGRNGDGLNVLIDFSVKPTTAANTRVDVWMDITGGAGTPAALANLYRRSTVLSKGQNVEHFVTVSVAGYTLDTWEANGAVVKVEADAAIALYATRVVLTRTHKART